MITAGILGLLENGPYRDRPEVRALRSYLRWEYGSDDVEWYLRSIPRPPRTRISVMVRAALGRLRLRVRPVALRSGPPDVGR